MGRTAYRKFMGECLKRHPPKRARAIATSQDSEGPHDPRARGTHFPKYRGRRREAGATSPSANVMPRRGTEVFRFLIFTVRRAGTDEARPLSRRRPLSSTGAGDFEVRSRYALTALRLAPARLTQSSTSFEIED